MADAAPARLSALLSSTRVLALVGLAKNTGKTVTLAAILAEHAAAGRRVGVTSIGRDGEHHDVIDARIEKPSVQLQAGDLVASTGALLRASGLEHERIEQTGVRTPLGEVAIARLSESGDVEVAGPSAAADVRGVAERMLALGAEQVLIDGAIDRRAASSPAVADGLVMATGAILSNDPDRVVEATRDAVDLVRLPAADGDVASLPTLARRLVLTADPLEIAALLRERPDASAFAVEGALGERFLEGLLAARVARELRIVVADPTRVFLSQRSPRWYARQGIAIEVLRRIDLKAITVNPVAPQAHAFDSRELRKAIEAVVSDVPILDVLDSSYLALAK
jgi:hypothetical protein